MIFDTHAHYDDEAFDEDRPELLGRFAGSRRGCGYECSRQPWKSLPQYLKLAEA